MRSRELVVDSHERRVPAVLWWAGDGARRRPVVLIGHGGSQHKTHPGVVALAARLVEQHGFAAFAIDGPIHGARRADMPEGPRMQAQFLEMWKADPRIDAMVADWRAALDVLAGFEEVDAEAIGWYGVSMGTAYGLPLAAAEPRIKAALLGMWGGDFPNSGRLLEEAPRVRCPVLFQQKWDDQIFTREGQLRLFERIGSADKWLKIYPGTHVPVAGEQLDDALAFLVRHLAPPNAIQQEKP